MMKFELHEGLRCLGKAEGTHGSLSLKTYDTPCGNVGSAEEKLTYGVRGGTLHVASSALLGR